MQRDRRLFAVLLAALMVASVATVGGAALGQSPTPTDATNSAQTTQPNTSNDTDGWPAPRADSGRTGVTSDDGPLPYANESWRAGNWGYHLWGPVVTGDTLVMAYAGDEYPHGVVEAYNTSSGDGEVRWTQEKVGEPTGPASVADGRVFVSTISDVPSELPGAADANRTGLYALNATTGEILWRVNDTRSAPVVAGDRVFTSHQPAEFVDPDDQSAYGNVSAHNATTGERIWTSDVQGEVVASADGRVFVTDEQSKTLTALDASDGSLLWRTTVGDDFYFEREDFSSMLNYREGELAATDDALYLTVGFAPGGDEGLDHGNATARVSAYATDDGAKLWEQNITTESGTTPAHLSAPAVVNGTVYAVSDAESVSDPQFGQRGEDVGTVHALDAETGAQQWTFSTTNADLISDPAVANGTVYVGGSFVKEFASPFPGPHVAALALDASDGTERWNLTTDAHLENSMGPHASVVADGRFYVAFRWGSIDPATTIIALESQEDPPPESYQIRDYPPHADIDTPPPPGDDGYYAPNTTVTLSAADSGVIDEEIVSYEWDVDGDGEFEETGETIEVTTAADACETVTVTLRVTDAGGGTDETTVTLQTEP